MTLTDDDLEWLKSNEGCPKDSYRDDLYHSYRDGGGGEWTIYFGCCFDADGCKVTKSTVWTKEEAERNFKVLHNACVITVNRLMLKDHVKLTQKQFSALVDFEYNTGRLASSTLWKKIAAGAGLEEIEYQFLRWVYDNGKFVNGLKNRRLKEISRYKEKDFA